jgi:hypothetical protein
VSDDIFKDVREVEREAREAHESRVGNITAAIAVADSLISIGSGQGYNALRKSIQDLLEWRTRELLSVRDDRAGAVLQGRCLELKGMLSLLENTRANRDTLALALQNEEDVFLEASKNFRPEVKKT